MMDVAKVNLSFFLPVACYNSLKFCTCDAIFYATLIYIRITSELTKACIIKVVKGCRPLYWTQGSTQYLKNVGPIHFQVLLQIKYFKIL